MRLFTAIELPEDVKQTVSTLNWNAHRAVSPVRAANLHITLKFLGEVPADRLPALRDALSAIRTARAGAVRAVRVMCLPERGAVRVVSLALEGDTDRLELLYRLIEDAVALLGFPRERRRFCPHITLARARPPLRPADRELLEQTMLPAPPMEICFNEFTLFESRQSAGIEYLPVASFPL